ncbi:hypothetical protein T484DRAFT_3047423 [Baffinella frigidus]|nr:hypothetical protein T484DRAFT_3047423 [Cryptophyta sp. CCMP2293]
MFGMAQVEERLKAWDGRMGVAWERYTAAASGELPPSPRAPSPSLVTNLRSPGVHLSTMQPSPKAANGSVSFSSKVLPTAFRGKGPAHTRLGSTVGAGRHAVVSSPLGGRGGEGGAHNVGGVSSGSKFVKKGARKKIVGEHDQLAAQREALQEVQRVVAEAEEVKEDRARLERRRVRAAARKEIEEGRADAATLIALCVPACPPPLLLLLFLLPVPA